MVIQVFVFLSKHLQFVGQLCLVGPQFLGAFDFLLPQQIALPPIAVEFTEILAQQIFPTPLASDKGTSRDAANLDVFLSDNGIFRKRNKNGTIWSLSLSAAVFYLTPAASEGYRSTLKPTAFRNQSPSSNLSAQMIRQEQPVSDTAALNPDWVEWLMGFPQGWTDVSSGTRSPMASPA